MQTKQLLRFLLILLHVQAFLSQAATSAPPRLDIDDQEIHPQPFATPVLSSPAESSASEPSALLEKLKSTITLLLFVETHECPLYSPRPLEEIPEHVYIRQYNTTAPIYVLSATKLAFLLLLVWSTLFYKYATPPSTWDGEEAQPEAFSLPPSCRQG